MEHASIREPEVTAHGEKRMRHPRRANPVPASDAISECEDVIRLYPAQPLPFFNLGQYLLAPP